MLCDCYKATKSTAREFREFGEPLVVWTHPPSSLVGAIYLPSGVRNSPDANPIASGLSSLFICTFAGLWGPMSGWSLILLSDVPFPPKNPIGWRKKKK